jgi:hypothetical protein
MLIETGHTWRALFPGRPDQARPVRRWVRSRLAEHADDTGLTITAQHADDTELLASELFTAASAARPHAVQMTISTAGPRLRLTATAPEPLPSRARTRVAWRIVLGIAGAGHAGVDHDERTLWAQISIKEGT